jgi:hypothetical protein
LHPIDRIRQVGIEPGRNRVVLWCSLCGALANDEGAPVDVHRIGGVMPPGSSAWKPAEDRSIGLVWLLRRWLINHTQPESSTHLRGLIRLTQKALGLEVSA